MLPYDFTNSMTVTNDSLQTAPTSVSSDSAKGVDYRQVLSGEDLVECLHSLNQAKVLAVDTEFMRTDTFYPILGLIQINDGRHCWLVDPLAVEDLSPLTAVFENPDIVKVFHSCSEDLEVLQHSIGCMLHPVFDTQVAAAIAGYGYSKSYAALVDEILDIHVEKGETRSDWLQRPLSESQLGYAALDVLHLLQVYHVVHDAIVASGRDHWMVEEMAATEQRAEPNEDFSQYYLKVKSAWKLDRVGLGVLQRLCAWREGETRHRDRPRNRLVADKTLLNLAREKPQDKAVLGNVEGMYPGIMRRYADTLLSIITAPQEENSYPPAMHEPLPKVARDIMQGLKATVRDYAERLQIPVELLANKKDYEEIVRSVMAGQPALSQRLASGWRFDVVGEALLTQAKAAQFSTTSTTSTTP